jgi:hypothetical protein
MDRLSHSGFNHVRGIGGFFCRHRIDAVDRKERDIRFNILHFRNQVGIPGNIIRDFIKLADKKYNIFPCPLIISVDCLPAVKV